MRHRKTQADRLGRLPTIGIGRSTAIPQGRTAGLTAADPVVLGEVTETMVAQLVRATGLFANIRAGQERWVIGDGLATAIADGLAVVVLDRPPVERVRLTNLPDGAPGADPDHVAGIDQWTRAFTTCLRCNDAAAGPGAELCPACTAIVVADPNESPLQRALREAEC